MKLVISVPFRAINHSAKQLDRAATLLQESIYVSYALAALRNKYLLQHCLESL